MEKRDNDFTDYLKKNKVNQYEVLTDASLKDDSFNCAGVWALFGTEKESKEWRCLQVGQTTKSMSAEIKKNIRIMGMDLELEQPYRNQWGVEVFNHPKQLKSPGMWAYTDIPKKYDQLKWIVISHPVNNDDLRKIEREFANKFQAEYWRDGRPPEGKLNKTL